MIPYHISCNLPADGLYPLNDGRYQLIAGGALAPLMIGHGYVLSDGIFLDLLAAASAEGFTTKPSTIYRRSTNEQIESHLTMRISRHFDSKKIDDLDLEGARLILMDSRYLFCTPLLAESISQHHLPWLIITAGFTNFG